MIGAPNASRRLAYSVAYSIAALAIPRACAATIGRVCSNVPSVAEPECCAALDRFARLGEFVVELVLAAEQVGGRHPDAVELQLGGVRGAAPELVELADHLQARRAAGHDEQRLPLVAELLVDDGVDDVDVGDAAVADPHLVAVDDPVGIRSRTVAAGRGAQVPHVAAALGFGDRQCGELEIAWRSEAFGRPLEHLLRRSRLADRRQRERGHHDRQADPGAAPEQLLHEHRQRQPGRVADEIAVEQRAVEAPAAASSRTGHGNSWRWSYSAATGRTTCSANSWVRRARSCCAAVGREVEGHQGFD